MLASRIARMVNLKPIYPSIVCFGDSQTQYANGAGGFVAALGDIYQRRADVINRYVRSFGETSRLQTDAGLPGCLLWLLVDSEAIRPEMRSHWLAISSHKILLLEDLTSLESSYGSAATIRSIQATYNV